MQLKISLIIWLWFIVSIVAIMVIISFLITIFFVSNTNIDNTLVAGVASDGIVNPGLPIRLKIPKINVDASLKYVGLNNDGTMDTTKEPDDVAWFEPGPRPGENGSAVIAGHYGSWKDGRKSVFDNLNKLSRGDKIYIEDEKGATIIFVVRELRTFGINEDASDVFGSSDGTAHLNLITCQGEWDIIQETYSNRLVIFADKE